MCTIRTTSRACFPQRRRKGADSARGCCFAARLTPGGTACARCQCMGSYNMLLWGGSAPWEVADTLSCSSVLITLLTLTLTSTHDFCF